MNREILRLAIPNIISNISVPLLSSIDTALMGQLSARHLGAVGIASMLFNFIYWNFGFLRMGTTGITAQAYGAKNVLLISNTFSRAGLVAFVLGLLLIILQLPIEWVSIRLFQVDPTQVEMVGLYFRIRIWAAPASLLSYVILGWFFGMQNAKYPLYLTIAVNVANILLSYFLIVHMDYGIAGAAWGTLIAQYLGLIVGIILLKRRYNKYLQHLSLKLAEDLHAFKGFFQINIDLFIRTLSLTFVFGFFYSQSSAAGPLILAVNVILLQMVNWMSYGIDGFAYAAESLIGKYKGKQDRGKVNQMIWSCMYWGLGLAILFALLYGFYGTGIFAFFTQDDAVRSVGDAYMVYMIFFPIAGFISYIWDGIYIGLTASRTMRNAMLASLALFLILYHALQQPLGNHGLWLALLLFLLGRGLIQSMLYLRYGWMIR